MSAHTQDEVYTKVQEVLVEALGVDDDEVRPEATLFGDLGAESIDFLDIAFRLEKIFNIKVPRDELFPEDVFTSTDYVQDGKITPAGLEELRRRMPFVDLSEFERDPAVQKFRENLKVSDLCRFVEHKLAG
jgi:acyl carrier protein